MRRAWPLTRQESHWMDAFGAFGLAPAALLLTWIGVWFVPVRHRWWIYFPAMLALQAVISKLVLGAVDRRNCDGDLPAHCASAAQGLVAYNQLTGFLAWAVLLAITVAVLLGRHLVTQIRLFFRPDEPAADGGG